MQSRATHTYARIAPRKVRLVADLLKGKKVSEAEQILRLGTKRAAGPLEKVLKSAVASARNNFALDETNLYVARITIDEGPKLKRYRPRARGRAYPIQKKTSHIMLVLDEITPTLAHEAAKEKTSEQTLPETPQAEQRQSGKAGLVERPKFRAAKDAKRSKSEGMAKRIFRRKAV